ncbi:MAG: 2-dehydropantoate 2-reductase [Clostridia bacterium]
MKYLIIGAGATGAPIAAYLANKNHDVSIIARNETLKKIQNDGLSIIKSDGSELNVKIKAYDEKSYTETPDIIFLCVKAYSVDSTIEFLTRVCDENTIVIPILNIYTTGEYLQQKLPHCTVTDGCIYIASGIKSAGVIEMQGEIFRVFFGERGKLLNDEKLQAVQNDLRACSIDAVHSKKMQTDAFEKFTFVSTMAACGLYHDCMVEKMQVDKIVRDDFMCLTREILSLADKMGLEFEVDVFEKNMGILDNLSPNAMASMQRDIAAGRQSEIGGLVHAVPQKAKEFGLTLPLYEKISIKFKNI